MESRLSNQIFGIYLASFCFGIVAAEELVFSFIISIDIFLIGLFYFLKRRFNNGLYKVTFIIFFIAAVSFGAGALRLYIFDLKKLPDVFESKLGIVQNYQGVITSEIERRGAKQRFVLQVSDHSELVNVLLTTAPYPEYHYGDEVSVKGALLHPVDFKTDTGNFFDYDTYLAKSDIFYVMKNTEVSLRSKNKGNFILSWLYALKVKLISQIDSTLPSPESSLLAGLLIAGKKAIPADVMNDFKIAGVVHIVVLSGYNVTIVAVAFMAILSFLRKQYRLIVGAVFIILFSLMVGETATVVRSVIMALVALCAQAYYSNYDVMRALLLSAFGMLLWNPLFLAHDPSFQLSFLATLGLMLVSPLITELFSNYIPWFPEVLGIKELVIATLATQLFVLPFIVYGSGVISLVALPVNMLVLICIPLTMLIGFISLCVNWLLQLSILHQFTNLSYPLVFSVYLMLSYELFITHFFASLPHAAIYTKHVPLWSVFVIYLLYTFILCFIYRRRELEENASLKPPS